MNRLPRPTSIALMLTMRSVSHFIVIVRTGPSRPQSLLKPPLKGGPSTLQQGPSFSWSARKGGHYGSENQRSVRDAPVCAARDGQRNATRLVRAADEWARRVSARQRIRARRRLRDRRRVAGREEGTPRHP